MDNATRRQLLQRHRQSGFPGSILDVYKAYDQGVDLLGQFEQQNNMQVAQTPQQQQQGLRPAHQAGNVNQSMAFPNVPPNTPFNTVGMKAPINIQKFDEQGHLVKSYENVPPGIQSLPTGPQRGTVIETPSQMQRGGIKKYQGAGTLSPYYASSKNDPRYIAYNDSLNLHLATLEQDRLMGAESYKETDNIKYWTPENLQDARTPKYNNYLGYDIAEDYQSQEEQFQDTDGDGKIDYNPSARREDEQLINYYKSRGFTDDNIMYHSSPDLVHPTIKPSYSYFDGTASSPYYIAPKQEVILSSKLPSIQPKQIPTSTPSPKLQIPKTTKYLNSTPIYRQDASTSAGQYQIGENMWDPNKKQWFRSMFDEEMQNSFREEAIPRKEKWRTIETPPGGFKNGGIRKAQNGLPPLTLGQTSPDWKATGAGVGLLNDNTAVSPQMKAGGVRKYQAGTPPLFGIDSELLKSGIAGTESSGGIHMMNPGSTATGLYGQRFSEIRDSYPGTREEFSTNIAAQDSIFDRRLYQGLNDERSMMDNIQHMYETYPDQIAEKGYNAEQVAGIINMLGRQGTRKYLGYVVRDKRDLAEVFPDTYGPNIPESQKNKTPDEYAQTMQWWMDRYAEDNCPGGECMKTTQKRGGRLGIKKYFKLRK